MSRKGRFEVEALDSGYKLSVWQEPDKKAKGGDEPMMYPSMSERTEAAIASKEELHRLLGVFLDSDRFVIDKPKAERKSMLSSEEY